MAGTVTGTVVRAPPFQQCGLKMDSRIQRHMWVVFVGSQLCSKSFFSWVLRFSPLLKNQLVEHSCLAK